MLLNSQIISFQSSLPDAFLISLCTIKQSVTVWVKWTKICTSDWEKKTQPKPKIKNQLNYVLQSLQLMELGDEFSSAGIGRGRSCCTVNEELHHHTVTAPGLLFLLLVPYKGAHHIMYGQHVLTLSKGWTGKIPGYHATSRPQWLHTAPWCMGTTRPLWIYTGLALSSHLLTHYMDSSLSTISRFYHPGKPDTATLIHKLIPTRKAKFILNHQLSVQSPR